MKIQYGFNLKDKKVQKYKVIIKKLTKKHNLEYEEHNYYINYNIKEDYENKPLIYIKKKMKNYNYLISLIKFEAIKNEIKDSNGEYLYDFINKKYNNLNIDYKNIKNLQLFKKEIKKYKIKNKRFKQNYYTKNNIQ